MPTNPALIRGANRELTRGLLRAPVVGGGGGDIIHDPLFSNVQFLMNFNGTDGQTTFDDLSDSNHAVARVGDMTHSDEQTKFGTTSAKFGDGTGDYLTMPAQLDSDLGYDTGATHFMTIEAWVYPTALDELMTIFGGRSSSNGYIVYIDGAGIVYLQVFKTSTAEVNELSAGGAILVNEWTHLAMEKDETTWNLYVNGVLILTDTGNAGKSAQAWLGNTFVSTGRDFIGYMDAVRYTDGELVYDGPFTPATVAPAES